MVPNMKTFSSFVVCVQIIQPVGKSMVTLLDGTDVTEGLHDLPVGTLLVVRRVDGATMDAMWDGEKLTSPKKGTIRDRYIILNTRPNTRFAGTHINTQRILPLVLVGRNSNQ